MFTRGAIVTFLIILFWQLTVTVLHTPSYILPGPILVGEAFIHNSHLLLVQTWPTLVETLLGFLFGAVIAIFTAFIMVWLKAVRYWLLPILIVSQALPTFAIAPLLVIWFGYGMASKIIVTMIIIFFPITSSFYDGLKQTNKVWVEMAEVMNGKTWQILWRIKFPAALPALASGLRVAAVFAPLGAIIGEWVGASRGLGFLMLNANARLEVSLMFSALIIIMIFSLLLYFVVDKTLRKIVFWS